MEEVIIVYFLFKIDSYMRDMILNAFLRPSELIEMCTTS